MGNITFTGLASGMDTSSWIEALVSIKQQSVTSLKSKQTTINSTQTVLDTVKSNVTALRTSIEKLTDSKLGGSFDLFAKNTVTSSKESLVTATATENAARQSLDIVVNQLATSTVATSAFDTKIDENTVFNKLSSGNAKEGSFSVYVDGKKSEIKIEENATLGDIISQLNNIEGINASIENGKFNITTQDGQEVVVGSATDESNFMSVLGLVKNSETGNYESFNAVSSINTSDKIFDKFGQDALGTFKIGNQEFTIDENTTFKSLIGTINAKADSGVTAHWDASNGNFVLKSKNEGAFNINIEAGTSNLTTLMGFTTSETDENGDYIKDENGNFKSNLVQSTQELGDYANLTINGTEIISSSNTVTSDISGIDGLTLTLNAVSKTDENGEKEMANISVEQDSKGLLDAVKSFIDIYNKTIENIDDKTTHGEALYGETSLTAIRNNLRRTATSEVSDSSLKLLANIGITTGKANASTDTSNVNKLQIDEEKFLEVLKNDPESVKELLLGDNKGNADSGGLLNKLEKITEDSLATTTGYFDAKSKSFSKQIEDIKNSMSREQMKIDSYRARLEKQFSSMELIISSMQSSYSQLSI